jgi:hypothetical protein
MSTYRSRLEAGIHPGTDPRRGPELRAELRRLAEALAPRWQLRGDRDDFAAALLRIGARLAEQSTLRLDGTAKRVALAFFDFLGLPPDPPRAASGVLVLALEPKQVSPVRAPVRTQVAVTAADNEEAIFETQSGLRVIPGGIAELFAVDPSTDHIEQAPAQVTSILAPQALPAAYRFVTFTGAGNSTIQLSPAAGIAESDLLRIGDTAYQVAKVDKNGLVTLHDKVQTPVAAGTIATRITSLETLTLRDLQKHHFYVGHADLLNLEQRAKIFFEVSPPSLAHALGELNIAYSLYGTPRGKDEADWHPLELLGTSGSEIKLAKTWIGPADITKVNGQPSRWIRAELRDAIIDRPSPTFRASGLRLTVASIDGEADGTSTPAASVGGGVRQAEGSQTVTHAAHNATPLATSGRFYPFGPEPIRFDTFALAAPEALSKRGALISLNVTLADSSMVSFGVTVADFPGPWSGYGVGLNGDLQVVFDDNDRFRWLQISAETDEGRRIVLGSAAPVAIGVYDGGTDVLVAQDRKGGLWSAVLRRVGIPQSVTVEKAWQSIERPASSGATAGMPAVVPTPNKLLATTAVLVDVRDGDLYGLWLDRQGRPVGSWTAFTTPAAGSKPAVSTASQLTAVQGASWPVRPDRLEIVARDDTNDLWVGSISADPQTGGFDVSWKTPIAGDSGHIQAPPSMSPDVAPTATRFYTEAGEERWWVSYANAGTDGVASRIVGVELADQAGQVTVARVYEHNDVDLAQGSALHSNPTLRGPAGVPAVVGLKPNREELLIWQADEYLTSVVLTGPASAARPQLLRIGTSLEFPGWEVLLPGSGERLFRATQPNMPTIKYALHNFVRFQPAENDDWAPDRVEIASDLDSPASRTMAATGDSNRILYQPDTGVRIYKLDAPQLTLGKKLRFMRLYHNAKRYKGTFETPEERDKLTFDKTEISLAVSTRIVIEPASYVITAVATDADGVTVATLDRAVPEENKSEFCVVDKEQDAVVGPDQLGTLLSLDLPAAPQLLAFGAPAVPGIQKILESKTINQALWTILREPWGSPPMADTAAVVLTPPKPALRESIRVRDYRNPELSWEYFDGDSWQKLSLKFLDGTDHLSTSGAIQFEVPPDLTPTEIGGKKDYWIRARLIGGDYGRPAYVVKSETDEQTLTATQTIVVDTTDLNPPEILAIEALFRSPVGGAPQFVLVENNAEVLDQTQAATLPSATFDLFQGASAIDPETSGQALFAGFSGPLSSGPLTLLVDAADQPGTGSLLVDVLMAEGWQRVPVDDRTASMRRTGIINLALQSDPVPRRLFGHDRVWLRFRPGSDPDAGPALLAAPNCPWAPVIRALLPNAVAVSHARTMQDEVLGSSLGAPGTTVHFAATPVLPGSAELRVREDLSAEDIVSLEAEHRARTGAPPDHDLPVVAADLERIPGTWVLWRRADSLIGQPRDARVFVLEPATGRVTFGDDQSGRIPPAGRDGIRAFSYQQGGGTRGNVPAWSETRMTTALAGVEVAVLPLGVAGGADTPPAESVFATAPHQLRHAGRAMTPADVEALVVASSGDILRARCRRPVRLGDPIRVSIVVRDETSRRPQPTYAQRQAVAATVRAAGWGGLDVGAVHVSGPSYAPLSIRVALVAPPDRWAEVEKEAKEHLVGFFDPAHGGPFGNGWPFGRGPDPADLLRELNRVQGIDRVASAEITTTSGLPLGVLPLDGMVCAEVQDITVSVSGEGDEAR